MSTEQELLKAKSSIQSALEKDNVQTCLDILESLQKIKVTGEVLKKTDIGKIVGKLRSHKDTKLSIKAKSVVKKWKEDVLRNSTNNNTTSSAINTPTITPPTSKKISPSSSQASSPKTPSIEGPPRTMKSDEVTFHSTGNGPRDKTIELIYNSIAFGCGADSDLLIKRALAIEKTLYLEYNDVNQNYKNKVRSLALNLKNKNNPGLRESVVSGELSVSKLCKMGVEEMASEEAQARDRKLAEEALFKARGAGSAQAETDMFKCGKCGGRKCTYFQMQTRSADEPMTTFVTCVGCGNHWKFC
ncbi:transcription elongation factor S-II [Cokeromyces recurvatus]|uniref:transcription elongation factor S-II n=1 Tax=Cokeromyces recurvatus TaxID=90255 RepID=UPI00221EA61C|nr:transcription elongation factor S-II [Cokeromyces recurvatus]KAI7902646.1 transcription elongation factor S-II [Cokeromyces recurvatus]